MRKGKFTEEPIAMALRQHLRNLARVGKARALVNLQQFAQAAAVVARPGTANRQLRSR